MKHINRRYVLKLSTNSLLALSLTCSHLGCLVETRNLGYEYTCHSSRYEPDGRLLRGPAA